MSSQYLSHCAFCTGSLSETISSIDKRLWILNRDYSEDCKAHEQVIKELQSLGQDMQKIIAKLLEQRHEGPSSTWICAEQGYPTDRNTSCFWDRQTRVLRF